eukprot:7155679-Alexandrium_andersonii.AAC.1
MACAISTRPGACSARGHGGGASSLATCWKTCGSTPVNTSSHHHIHGAAASPCKASRDHRSPRGRRATARASRDS